MTEFEGNGFAEIIKRLEPHRADPERLTEVLRASLRRLGQYIEVDGYRERNIAEMKAQLDWDPEPLLDSGVDEKWLGFDSFMPVLGSKTVQEACNLTMAWVKGEGPNTLVLAGPVGVGKTHLAKAAAHQLIDQQVIYRQESRMIGELQAMIGPKGPLEECIVELCQIRWLVLDEFGGTALGNWGASVMDRIINERWDSHCRTLITTNLTSNQMTPRMRSRLGDATLATAIVIKAPDYRKQKR